MDPLATSPSWIADGENAGDSFGSCVATAGDVNGDGYSDVLVSAYNYAVNTGKVYLYMGSPSGLSGTASWTKTGDAAESYYGLSAATAGDVNGDGYSDVVIGVPGDGVTVGKAELYLGGPTGLSATAAWSVAGQADSYLGMCVATAGDVNGDGYSDVLVSGHASIYRNGVAYLYLGSPSGLSASYSWSVEGQSSVDYYGYSLGTAGDVNGDGYADVVVGARGYSTNSGQVYVYLGGSSGLSATAFWTQVGENWYDLFGHSVSTAGDVNGDGYSDILVGASGYDSNRGKVYLYLGSASGLTASWSKMGENTGDQMGQSVSTAGDVNGDGYADALVGAYYNSPSGTYYRGRAYLFGGGPAGLSDAPLWSVVGEEDWASLGNSVGTAGDVNGDGFSDILVGAYSTSGSAGRAYLYLGGAAGPSATPFWSAAGENASDRFGYSVASAGDVNGDGYSDVAVGADGPSSYAGKAYLYLGGPSGLSSTAAWTAAGEGGSNYYGCSVATAGDVNGDGYSDVVVGASGYNIYSGKAYLYLGGPSGLSSTAAWTATGEGAFHYFGQSVAAGGDVNGDGYSDVLVGAHGYGSPVGRAYLYLGGASGLSSTPSWTATGEASKSKFGYSLATAGDVNG